MKKEFLIKNVKIDSTCCFVQLEDGRWMGLGDLIYEVFNQTAKLGIVKISLKITIESGKP